MGRKYLKDLGLDKRDYNYISRRWFKDKRIFRWIREKFIYGFASYETWSLDYTYYLWVYERLSMFWDKSKDIVSWEETKFEFEGRTISMAEAIPMMIEGFGAGCKDYLINPNDEEFEKLRIANSLWAITVNWLWW